MLKSRVILISLWLCVLLSHQVCSLSCGECRPSECEVKQCNFGTVKDACKCCDICAKGLKEECGGLWGLGGACAENLTCTFSNLPDGVNFHFFRTGICLPEDPAVEENLTH